MKQGKGNKRVAFTGVLAAVAASSCCIPPFIALIAGVGGSASALSWVEPFRPYLIFLAVVAIGYAWFNHFKSSKEDDCCVIEKPKWFQTRTFLIVITLFAVISISFPHFSHLLYPESKKEVIVGDLSEKESVEFDISGMTCTSCENHVNHEIQKLEGIINSEVSYKNQHATIEFDPSSTNKLEIEEAINSTGYKVKK